MGACREGASIWFALKKWNNGYLGIVQFVKRKRWRSPYFWHDSFGMYWNRLIGCKLHGHKNIRNIGDCGKVKYHCFGCERGQPSPDDQEVK